MAKKKTKVDIAPTGPVYGGVVIQPEPEPTPAPVQVAYPDYPPAPEPVMDEETKHRIRMWACG